MSAGDQTAVTAEPGTLTADQRLVLRRRLELLIQAEDDPVERVATLGPQAVAAYNVGMRDAVRDALAKMDEGTYGRCESCHAPIPVARLEALPYARRCVPCQERMESGWDQVRRLVGQVVRSQGGEVQGPSEVDASASARAA